MQKDIWIVIRGTQRMEGEEPQAIEFTTAGTMGIADSRYEISYVESELTGMEGVRTTFTLLPERVILSRSGAVDSKMVFAVGEVDKSLYDMGFGALLMQVRARKVEVAMESDGGFFDLSYTVELEQTAQISIDYHIEVKCMH